MFLKELKTPLSDCFVKNFIQESVPNKSLTKWQKLYVRFFLLRNALFLNLRKTAKFW